ncbi:MAG TPA: DUF6786 family protein, partial [Bacteroidales bacterium]|nr:DUF6786 family protein [Bacteroidales bacterium]
MTNSTDKYFRLFAVCMIIPLITACKLNNNVDNKATESMTTTYNEGTYGYDVDFFKNLNIETIELKDSGSNAMVLIVPGYQGRVMTSTSDGYEGTGYGWIKYDLIKGGQIKPQFNPYGGEERLWLGPEGGMFSVYFKKGTSQEFANWNVPKEIDTEPFEVVSRDMGSVKFKKDFKLVNYSGTPMEIGIERTVKILSKGEVETALGFAPDKDLKFVAFQSENLLFNKGNQDWTERSGILSIWMLSMFRPSDNGVVVIPFRKGSEK